LYALVWLSEDPMRVRYWFVYRWLPSCHRRNGFYNAKTLVKCPLFSI